MLDQHSRQKKTQLWQKREGFLRRKGRRNDPEESINVVGSTGVIVPIRENHQECGTETATAQQGVEKNGRGGLVRRGCGNIFGEKRESVVTQLIPSSHRGDRKSHMKQLEKMVPCQMEGLKKHEARNRGGA